MRKDAAGALCFVVFLAAWLGTFLLCLALSGPLELLDRHYNKERIEPGRTPGYFPVVVVSPSGGRRAEIVFLENVPDYLKEHPDFTFLIPERVEITRAFKHSRLVVELSIQRLAEGRQHVEVGVTHVDSRLFAEYEAVDKEVEPRY